MTFVEHKTLEHTAPIFDCPACATSGIGTSLCFHGRVIGHTWVSDGSICCWLCVVDERNNGFVTVHHKFPIMHSNLELTTHMISDHNIFTKGENYWSQLPEDVQHGKDLHGKPKESKQHYLQRMQRIADQIQRGE